jgi:hypothetical protein
VDAGGRLPDEGESEDQEGEQEEAPEPEPEPPARRLYDGLDSGLSWFGAEPFEPPVPAGYLPPAEAGAAGAAPLAPAEAAERRQRIRERLEARRKEADAQRKWYQKIPLAAYIPVPATLFIIIWIVFVAKPWRRIPNASEELDASVLAPRQADDAQLAAMDIEQGLPPKCWRLAGEDLLVMDASHPTAQMVRSLPEGTPHFEVSCDVCLVEGFDEHSVRLRFDEARAVGLVFSPRDPDTPQYIGARRTAGGQTREWSQPMDLKYRYWYALKIRVDEDGVRYFVNGRRLSPEPRLPPPPSKVMVSVVNARAAVRRWRIEPLE